MMRAARYERHGEPEVLRIVDVPRPAPARSGAVIRVLATSVNPVEAKVRAGALRALTGWTLPHGTGLDFYGEVVEAGERYAGPLVGELVWGFRGGLPMGTQLAAAEFMRVRPSWLSLAPRRVGADAAALPLVASTAYSALTRITRLQPGERLLVRGASGGVGSAAVQLGKHFGAHVTGVAGAGNLEFVSSLGADVALDYAKATPDTIPDSFDVIIDVVGTGMRAWRRLLSPRGRFATTATKGTGYTLLTQLSGRKRIRPIIGMPRASDLAALAGLVDRGELNPSIGARFPLERIADAHRALAASPGKVLVTLE